MVDSNNIRVKKFGSFLAISNSLKQSVRINFCKCTKWKWSLFREFWPWAFHVMSFTFQTFVMPWNHCCSPRCLHFWVILAYCVVSQLEFCFVFPAFIFHSYWNLRT